MTVHIEVTHIEPEPQQQVLTDDPTIPSSEAQECEGLFEERGTKRVLVEPEDGQQSQHEWSAESDSQSGYLSVRIEEDAIEFSRATG